MNTMPSSSTQLVLAVVIAFGISACVTTEDQVFTKEATPAEALAQRMELARRYIQRGLWEDAKRHLRTAVKTGPDAPEVHEAFALVYQNTGEIELAEKSYKRALALDKDFSRARNNFATFLYQLQRYSEAEAQLEIVVQDTLYESRVRAYLNLGLCRLRLQDAEGAAKALYRTLSLDRSNRIALLELAQIEFNRANWQQAKRHFDTYRALVSSQSARVLWLGLRLAHALGDEDAQASYALALRNLFPESTEYRLYEKAGARGDL